jgi:hypothetical protein
MLPVKYATAVDIYLPAITRGTQDYLLNPPLGSTDAKISVDGAVFTVLTSLPSVSPAGESQIKLPLSAAETTGKLLNLQLIDKTVPKAWEDQSILLYTYGNASAHTPIDLSKVTLDVNTVSVGGTAQTAGDIVPLISGIGTAPKGLDAIYDIVSLHKEFFVNAAMPDDTGDGLSYATAKKLFSSVTVLIASGDKGIIWLVAGTVYAYNITVPANFEVRSLNGIAYIVGVTGDLTPLVTLESKSKISGCRIRKDSIDAIDKVILMKADSEISGCSGHIRYGSADRFIELDGSTSTKGQIVEGNLFGSGSTVGTNHAVYSASGNVHAVIKDNIFNDFYDDFIDLSNSQYALVDGNNLVGVLSGKYGVRLVFNTANTVRVNGFSGAGEFIIESSIVPGTDSNIIQNNGQWSDAVWDEVLSGHTISGSAGFQLDFLAKCAKNKREYIYVNPDWFLVTYDDDNATEILRQKVERYGATPIGDLTGTKTPSIRYKSSV